MEYILNETERLKWNIFNDGTHSMETTIGINNALKWASDNNITVFKVPEGIYLIAKGSGEQDPLARINMVSNLTFELENNAVIRKEKNGFKEYYLLYIGRDIENVTIKGGSYVGDKTEHDFSSGGTHEFGYGINITGANNIVIDNIRANNFTGDGIFVGGSVRFQKILYEDSFESGSINDLGNPVSQSGKIRTKSIKLDNKIYKDFPNLYFWQTQGLYKGSTTSVFYYDTNGNFIKSDKDLRQIRGESIIPDSADSYRLVFDAATPSGARVAVTTLDRSNQVVIKNSDISHNRRQGVSIVGAKNIEITNNSIHHINGTPPSSGIDIEGGFMLNNDIIIKDNVFYNNASYNIILYDGKNVTVINNYLGPNENKSSIGLAISSPFDSGAIIAENIFHQSKIAVGSESLFTNNIMINSVASITGSNVKIHGMTFIDSTLISNSNIPLGNEFIDILMDHHQKVSYGIIMDGEPAYFKNLIMNGTPQLNEFFIRSIKEGSIFDSLQLNNLNPLRGTELPCGTFNNCSFKTESLGTSSVKLSKSGKYTFNNCTFQLNRTNLVVSNPLIDLSISNSSFNVLKDTGTGVSIINIEKANKVILVNNLIDGTRNINKLFKLIQIGMSGTASTTVNVKDGTIQGNILKSITEVEGISTVFGGVNANPYLVENNKLYNASLNLKSNDINRNNQLIKS